MVTSEREMVKKPAELPKEERFTSLQPTYEDTVPPDAEDEWDDDLSY
jgi:hypothetical protein